MYPRIGPYEVIREIGQGALAIVYEAQDIRLKRKVALKVLHPIFSKNKNNLERLAQEASVLAQFNHLNIIHIYEFLDAPEGKGIVTEYVEGQSLAQFLEKHSPVLPEIACLVIADILSALEHAHSKKIIHRDIKPQNIIINKEGQIKLADFSIAKILDKECLTLTGVLVGSPFYMSPEQVVGKEVDERSDLFMVGTLLYNLVTGHLPFFDEDPKALFKKILDGDVQSPKTNAALDAIILKSLHREKEKRYQTAWEFRYDILKYLKDADVSTDEIRLKDFFRDPSLYTKERTQKNIKRYLEKGQKAFEQKKFIEASQYWNKVLNYDPENSQVQAHLKKISSRNRLTKTTYASFIIILFLVVARIGTFIKPQKSTPQQTVASAPPTTERPIISAPKKTWSYLQVNMDEDAFFYLDDKRIKFKDGENILKLSPGKHKVHFKKEGFRDIKTEIVLKEGETSTINIKRGS